MPCFVENLIIIFYWLIFPKKGKELVVCDSMMHEMHSANEIAIHAFVSLIFMMYGCVVCTCKMFCCSVVGIGENKSPTTIGNEECRSSYFVKVKVLKDGFP